MDKINWNPYKKQIINLHLQGKNATEILDVLRKYNPEQQFNRSSDRQVRRIVERYKDAVGDSVENNGAKILIYDIETHPITAYTWNKWPKSIDDSFIIKDWGILCWSAKWLFEEEVMSAKMTKDELMTLDDERISKSLWQLFDEADVIIAHNNNRFDNKKANTKFLQYKLGRPSPYQTIDTLLHARKRFSITSNRLDYIAQNFFGIEGKMHTEKGLWRRCMNREYDALEYMSIYCDQDVRVLEDVYLKMRGWIYPHPNISLIAVADDDCCPACGNTDREETGTPYRTYVNEYTAFRCGGCGHIYRSRKSNTPIKSNAGIKVSTPK